MKSITSTWWYRLLICSLIAAFAVPIIETAFHVRMTWPQTLSDYTAGIFYSLSIGGVLSPLAPLIWKRTIRTPAMLRWIVRAAFVAVGTGVGCLIAGIPLRALFGPGYHYWASFQSSYGIAIVFSVVATAFSSTYEGFKARLQTTELQLKEREMEREKAQKLAAEATLSSLESRMHPHFLFNTINSISSLIQEDPARAEKMLGQMADLLRFSLDSGRARLVPLSRELKIVHDYLEIEKARFEDRLRYAIHVGSEFDDVPIPPLSLQTLVENSVKYAVSVTRSGADIVIRAAWADSHAVVTVADNGPGFDAADLPPGHGLSNLQQRLQSLYGASAQLEIASRMGCTSVALRVPLRAAAYEPPIEPQLTLGRP